MLNLLEDILFRFTLIKGVTFRHQRFGSPRWRERPARATTPKSKKASITI